MPQEVVHTPQPRSEELTKKKKPRWTLMCYIAGDANISATMISQLKELTDAGYQEDTTVLVYFDPNCNGTNARIFEVNHFRKQKGADRGDPTEIGDGPDPYVRNIAEDCHIGGLQQMPAAVTLRYFLEYSRYYYPAENYMLFLMGHGVIVGNDTFLPDTDDGSAITLQQLGQALTSFSAKIRNQGAEFHLVGFHSCSMSSVELASELRGTARYMVGTQGSAFPGSWPYRQMLKKIFHEISKDRSQAETASKSDPSQVVQEILAGIQNLSFYNGEDFWYAGYSADISMCNLRENRIDELTLALQVLARALKAGLKTTAKKGILLAHCDSQSYFGERYTDIYDLCDRLLEYCNDDKAITDACITIKASLETYEQKDEDDIASRFDKLVVFSDFYGSSYQFSHGLSIYFPWSPPSSKVMSNYANYAFTRRSDAESSWMSFLEAYFQETKRGWDEKGLPIRSSTGKRIPLELAKKSWSELTDKELLFLGNPPPDKESPSLAVGTGDKESPSLAVGTGDKESPSLAVGTGDKESPSLAVGTGDKESPSLAVGIGDKESPSLAVGTGDKETPSMGAIGGTVIKNFPNPADKIITSRPGRHQRPRRKSPGRENK